LPVTARICCQYGDKMLLCHLSSSITSKWFDQTLAFSGVGGVLSTNFPTSSGSHKGCSFEPLKNIRP
jgi:hypothetical protein